MKGEVIWSLPGYAQCAFLDDGRVFATQKHRMVMFDKSMNMIWKLPIVAHHQNNFSKDGILVISEEYIKEGTVNGVSVNQTSIDSINSDLKTTTKTVVAGLGFLF